MFKVKSQLPGVIAFDRVLEEARAGEPIGGALPPMSFEIDPVTGGIRGLSPVLVQIRGDVENITSK